MTRFLVVPLALFAFAVSLHDPFPQNPALTLGDATEVTAKISLYRPIGLEVGRDGAVFIGDSGTQEIIKLSPEGEVIWRVGREGQGPGEFRHLYRIAVGQGGGVAAFDLRDRSLSWFEADGRFVRKVNIRPRVYTPMSLELMGEDLVALVGYLPNAPRHSVHVFDAEGENIFSFGPLPPVEDQLLLRDWPAGFLEPSGPDFLFTLNLPYEVSWFSRDGGLLMTIRRAYEFAKGPSDAQPATTAARGARFLGRPRFVPHPLGAKDLGDGWILAGVLTASDASVWDLFHDGELVASFPAPNGWLTPAAVDPRRRVLYVREDDAEGNPIYLQVPYTIDGGARLSQAVFRR